MVLSPGATELIFTPSERWAAGEHHLRVLPALEDLAGNNLRGAFDRSEKEVQEVAVAVELPFQPREDR